MIFLGLRAAPGPPPRAISGAPGGHPGPKWRPEAPRNPPEPHFGPSAPPPLEHFSFIFCDFRPAFLKRSRFLGLFFFACVFVLALCFGGFDALILQV